MHEDDEIALDELTRLQISVARRADELARDCKVRTPLNIHCWLMAESEHIDRSLVESGLAGMGPVRRRMVQHRASELALSCGRQAHEVRQADYEQAKRELTGERDADRQNEVLYGPHESKGWFPSAGSTGLDPQPA